MVEALARPLTEAPAAEERAMRQVERAVGRRLSTMLMCSCARRRTPRIARLKFHFPARTSESALWEAEFLSTGDPSYPAKRRRAEEPDSPMRTPFQRDRDRIVHSKAFRRLKHKTQVFVAPEGDHYRTRLTHTLEACGIARTVARALGLNEDLTEAIGLGHDLGPPALRPHRRGGARQGTAGALQRRVQAQRPLAAGRRRSGARRPGLNLTEQVRDGILNHTGSHKPATLEGGS